MSLKIRVLRTMANGGEDLAPGDTITVSKQDAERLIGYGAAEYVQAAADAEEAPQVEVKEEKQPEKATKEDKTAKGRTTKAQ